MKSGWLNFSILIFLTKFEDVSAANILFMSTMPGKSHSFWDKIIANILKDRGHNITMFTHFPEENQDNFTTIYLEDFYETHCRNETLHESLQITVHQMFWACDMTCDIYLHTDGFNKIIQQAKDGIKYDVIFFDLTSGPCLWPITKLFGSPPTIGTSAFGIVPYVAKGFGVPSQTAYYPFYSLPYSDEMTFFERFVNYFTHVYEAILKEYYWTRTMTTQKRFFGKDVKHYSAYERNFSLLFANYDPVLDYPKPIPPNVIALGGVHLREPKLLPKDLKSYMDNSKTGIIIVSLGTVIQSKTMKSEHKEMFLDAFSKLSENVIWKYEANISNLPYNVKTVKYLPQIDMLAHPNVKLFIGHGGILSTQESIFAGVPIVGMPLFLDQYSIIAKVVKRKVGVRLNYYNLSSAYILETIREAIRNPIYKTNAKKLSHYYRTLPERPRDRVINYTEHVIREGDADWLRPAEADLSFFQLNLLDVWLTIVTVVGVIVWSGMKILVGIWRRGREKLVMVGKGGEKMKEKVM